MPRGKHRDQSEAKLTGFAAPTRPEGPGVVEAGDEPFVSAGQVYFATMPAAKKMSPMALRHCPAPPKPG
jgi:hypothetical protein